MNYKLPLIGALALSLTACAGLSNKPPPTAVQENLVAACPPFPARPLPTNSQLAQAYLDALAWGADCRHRHNLQNGATK